ncbi:hypothetical protein [Oceanobacillus locisalsi]|uniref:Permease n=1 Tax=Oceanobacillus locisalsi TaxID=546107 RepID=A0ABW3NG03_9BACI
MKRLIIGIVILCILFLGLPLVNINNYILFEAIEWITKFIFPWIALYWLIRGVKSVEKVR